MNERFFAFFSDETNENLIRYYFIDVNFRIQAFIL